MLYFSRKILFLILLSQSVTLFARRLEWAHERLEEGIPRDPNVHYGHLTNDMRFAWISTPIKKVHCSLRLLVHVGSLREEEEEQGMAHFLEHLVFYNTKHYPKRSLIPWFEKNGMKFGADLNAHTSFEETVYKIDLPNCTQDRLSEALIVLQDFADGAEFLPEDVDKEQGVIDAEDQDGNTAEGRLFEKKTLSLHPKSTEAYRFPIGKKEFRAKFTAKKIRNFYTKWYRPEFMTLLLAGDFTDLDLTPLIQREFE